LGARGGKLEKAARKMLEKVGKVYMHCFSSERNQIKRYKLHLRDI
jgi:hypothetical protein